MRKRRHRRKLTVAQRKRRTQRNIRLGLILLIAVTVCLGIMKLLKPGFLTNKYFELSGKEIDASKPDINVELLTVNPYSRPGD